MSGRAGSGAEPAPQGPSSSYDTFFCEVAPSWDRFWAGQEGDYYCTNPERPDEDGRVVWAADAAADSWGPTADATDAVFEECRRPDPLLALLVAVPPPGGVVNVAYRHLGVAVHPTCPSAPPLLGGELQVPLRPLLSAKPCAPVHLEGVAGDGRLQVSMLVTWLAAPRALRRLLEPPGPPQGEAASSPSAPSAHSPAARHGGPRASHSSAARPGRHCRAAGGTAPAGRSPLLRRPKQPLAEQPTRQAEDLAPPEEEPEPGSALTARSGRNSPVWAEPMSPASPRRSGSGVLAEASRHVRGLRAKSAQLQAQSRHLQGQVQEQANAWDRSAIHALRQAALTDNERAPRRAAWEPRNVEQRIRQRRHDRCIAGAAAGGTCPPAARSDVAEPLRRHMANLRRHGLVDFPGRHASGG